MGAPVVRTEETHRDERFIYGERFVDGEYICEWMQPVPNVIPDVQALSEEKKARAQKIAKYLTNSFQGILNKHKIGWGRCDPDTVRLVWDSCDQGKLDRKVRDELMEYFVLYYDVLVSCVERLEDASMIAKLERFNEYCRASKNLKDKTIDIQIEPPSQDGDY